MSIEKYDDTYDSNVSLNLTLLGAPRAGESDVIPKVSWTLPNGDRLVTTLSDYNRNMPFIFKHEAQWKNAMNLRKRQRLGLTEAEEQELNVFCEIQKKYHEKIKKGDNSSQ